MRIERLVGFPDSEDQMQHLPQTMPQSHIAPFAAGSLPRRQRSNGRVASNGRLAGHPEQPAHEIVPFGAHFHRARGNRLSSFVDTGGIFLREDTEVTDQRLRSRKTVDGDDFGGQSRGGPCADAGDREQLPMSSFGQREESLLQQCFQRTFGRLTLADLGDEMADEVFCEFPAQRAGGLACRRLQCLSLVAIDVRNS